MIFVLLFFCLWQWLLLLCMRHLIEFIGICLIYSHNSASALPIKIDILCYIEYPIGLDILCYVEFPVQCFHCPLMQWLKNQLPERSTNLKYSISTSKTISVCYLCKKLTWCTCRSCNNLIKYYRTVYQRRNISNLLCCKCLVARWLSIMHWRS